MKKHAAVFMLVLGVSVLGFTTMTAHADTVVVPNVFADEPGTSNNTIPLDSEPMRYQQLYAVDQFQGMTGTVTQIAFRVDEEEGWEFVTQPFHLQVWLSHSTAQIGAMSTVFDENSGADKTLVYDDTITLTSDGTGAFDVIIDIDDTFVYNGTGNLLMEMKNYDWSCASSAFDSVAGGTTWTDRLYANGTDAEIGESSGDDGLVTQFTIVPEPATLALLALGCCAVRPRRA